MSSTTPQNPSRYFFKVREQLRYWPYTLHLIDDTLDTSLIEGKGRQIVFQALNAQNLTAFVGSGVSAAYGRMSWWEWRDEHLRITEGNAEAFMALTKASLAQLHHVKELLNEEKEFLVAGRKEKINQNNRYAVRRWIGSMQRAVEGAQQHVQGLRESFDHCKVEGDGFVGGDGDTIKLDITSQLHDAVESYCHIFLGNDPDAPDPTYPWNALWPGVNIDANPGAVRIDADKVNSFLGRMTPNPADATTYAAFREAYETFWARMKRPLARDSLEMQAKRMLASETAHALSILRAGMVRGDVRDGTAMKSFEDLEKLLTFPEPEDLRRNFPGIRDDPKKYRVLAPFLREKFNDLKRLTSFPPQWNQISAILNTEFPEPLPVDQVDRFVSPTYRFLVGALLCLQDDPKHLLLKNGDLGYLFPEIDRKHFTSRKSLIDDGLDPLKRIVSGLKIRRFVTTNYDFEIEREFWNRGFRRFPVHDAAGPRNQTVAPGPSDFSADATGSVLRDQTFLRDRAADLISFSIGDPRDEASVFHLHGRATASDPLVITERNYLDMYLMQDAHRETVLDGINMAFSGSPILFVGMGMTEDELLRPMRQFMANRDRTLGFSAVALMPAFKPIEKRTKFATSAYQRYGVHTVFYGGGEITLREPGTDGKPVKKNLDWLHRVTALIDALSAQLDESKKRLKAGKTISCNHKRLFDAVVKKVGRVGADLESDLEPVRPWAFARLVGFEDSLKTSNDILEKMRQTPDWAIQPCIFTPVRLRSENEKSRHYSIDTYIDSDNFLEFPRKLLTEILRLTLVRPSWTPDDLAQLAALQIMLNGLKGAILTGALNAALDGLEKGWQTWWTKWQESPPHRVARFEHVNYQTPEIPALFMRHRIDTSLGAVKNEWVLPLPADADLITKPMKGNVDPRERTGIRSFDTFVAAIASNIIHANEAPDQGRVMFTVLAQRGQGKGTFVSAFSCPRGLSMYEGALWKRQARVMGTSALPKPALLSAVFINFSFATEIASTFDMLLDALVDTASIVTEHQQCDMAELRNFLREFQRVRDTPPQPAAAYDDARLFVDAIRAPILARIRNLPRLDALREVMHLFKEGAERRDPTLGLPRILICLTSLDTLYDAKHRVKNPEIEAWLSWLTGPEMAEMPVDLVFLSSESGLGAPFDAPPGNSEDTPRRIRLDRAGLNPEGKIYIRERLNGGRVNLDITNPDDKDIARTLLSGFKWRHTDCSRSKTNFIHVVRPFNAVRLLIDNFKVLATSLWLIETKADSALLGLFKTGVIEGRDKSDAAIDALWKATQPPGGVTLQETRNLLWTEVEAAMSGSHDPWTFDDRIAFSLRTSKDSAEARSLRARLRQSRHYLHDNRFLMTILMAAAQNTIILAKDPDQGAFDARRFIDSTLDRARNTGADEVEEVVLQAVLDAYHGHHRIGCPDRDTELQGLVLRHLGVIGAPVQVDVLVRLPEFRDYFDRLKVELPTSRTRFLARTLTRMSDHALIYRLTPQPRQVVLEPDQDAAYPVDQKYRYALHRIVQRHVLAKLQVGTRDAIGASNFAPSIYAALPSPGNGLSTQGYNFIRALIIGLSQYPDIPRNDERLRPWLFTTNQANVRIQALRLALSLSRSTLSLPVFAALDGQTPTLKGAAKRGFLDTYKVRLRWIIRFAWESIHQETERHNGQNIAPHLAEDFNHLNALYRDEIVWLYNELGVISIGQGNLTEALGFLRLGREFNEQIEGPARRGPIGDRLSLNYAVVQIERGRIETAERHLKRLQKDVPANSLEALIVKGYLCLVNELRGRRHGVLEGFADVTSSLEARNEPRAQALFLLHHARAAYIDDPDEGLRLINQAHAVASAGGHEDIRNRIELSRVTLEWRCGKARSDDWSRRLIAVETYGRRMGIWHLQVDALRLRAERLLEFGESASAGELLVRAMAVAQRNRMMLRLNGAMTLYARTLMMRGETLAAQELAQKSLKLSRRLAYNLEEARASKLLTEVPANLDINATQSNKIPI